MEYRLGALGLPTEPSHVSPNPNERLDLDLSDPLPRQAVLVADLLEGLMLDVAESDSAPKYILMTRADAAQDCIQGVEKLDVRPSNGWRGEPRRPVTPASIPEVLPAPHGTSLLAMCDRDSRCGTHESLGK